MGLHTGTYENVMETGETPNLDSGFGGTIALSYLFDEIQCKRPGI